MFSSRVAQSGTGSRAALAPADVPFPSLSRPERGAPPLRRPSSAGKCAASSLLTRIPPRPPGWPPSPSRAPRSPPRPPPPPPPPAGGRRVSPGRQGRGRPATHNQAVQVPQGGLQPLLAVGHHHRRLRHHLLLREGGGMAPAEPRQRQRPPPAGPAPTHRLLDVEGVRPGVLHLLDPRLLALQLLGVHPQLLLQPPHHARLDLQLPQRLAHRRPHSGPRLPRLARSGRRPRGPRAGGGWGSGRGGAGGEGPASGRAGVGADWSGGPPPRKEGPAGSGRAGCLGGGWPGLTGLVRTHLGWFCAARFGGLPPEQGGASAAGLGGEGGRNARRQGCLGRRAGPGTWLFPPISAPAPPCFHPPLRNIILS